jgi:hypothetical protein
MSAVAMDRKQKEMDAADIHPQDQANDAAKETTCIPEIESSMTIRIVEDQNPSRSEASVMLTADQLTNVCKLSDYLREVIPLGVSSDNDQERILLREKNVHLSAQFLLILGDISNAKDPLPNLSYNLSFADIEVDCRSVCLVLSELYHINLS